MRFCAFVLAGLMLAPSAAWAQERDFCPDRPGIGTPACTTPSGTFAMEVGVGDWTLHTDADERQDVFLAGDFLVRYGIATSAEVQVGWTSLGFSRTRDRASGAVSHRSGTGDVTAALRRNFANPDGSGLSIAAMPFVTVPTGRSTIGAGSWSAGFLIPASYEVSDALSLTSTSEFDAAANEDSAGRHFAASETVGAEVKLAETITATAEYQFKVDRDPGDHHVEHVSGMSLGWMPQDNLQLDVGANAGLNHDADDVEVYFGISRRF